MKRITLLLLCFSFAVQAQQYRNANWCFGDSLKMNFNNSSPQFGFSGVCSPRTNVSISDNLGELVVYADALDYPLWNVGLTNTTTIRNKYDQVIQYGAGLIGGVWYHDLILVPRPFYNNHFFLFAAGVTHDFGLYLNEIDMNSNAGAGAVIVRDSNIFQLPVVDNLVAVKHGNGRDWWMICQTWDDLNYTPNNDFNVFLIDSSGVSQSFSQSIGPLHHSNGGSLTFSIKGGFFVVTDLNGMITKYNFDRCTGVVSNPVSIESDSISPGHFQWLLSSALSPSDRFLYVTSYMETINQRNYLMQYDLLSGNIQNSRVLIDSFYRPEGTNHIKLAPDNKIYLAASYECSWSFCLPYPDTVRNYINENLSVINQPDSPGVACDLQKFSVYLGGRRTYSCLPNNPNYELGPLVGSGCDTLSTGVAQVQEPEAQLYVTYESNWKKIFMNAQRLKGRQCRLSVFDVNGRLIDGDRQESYQGYYTKSMEMGGVASGVYLLRLETEKEVLTTKIVIP